MKKNYKKENLNYVMNKAALVKYMMSCGKLTSHLLILNFLSKRPLG